MVRHSRISKRFAEEETANGDRWVISYADFVTVLFAFFVVMYSISSVNEGQYKVLSESMAEAFEGDPSANIASLIELAESGAERVVLDESEREVVEADSIADSILEQENQAEEGYSELDAEDLFEDSFSDQALNRAEQEIDSIGSQVEQEMDEFIEDDLIDVRRNKFWLEVEIKSSLLFPSGSSNLLAEAVPVLVDLSESFVGMPNRLNIEGFTDNEPISTDQFPSNWELSASRAATVVRLFEQSGIEPARMASIGYGEHQPVAENDSAEGRARNRRVVIVVMATIREDSNEPIYDLDLLASD